MSESFHRKVKLGQLSWCFGLNGLAIATDKLSLFEADGSPFITSGRSEIGIAFTPLFQRRVVIKHLEFHQPEVFATQLGPGHWNFSDLLVPGPEIRYVEVDDGRLHLRNRITKEQLAGNKFKGVFANTNWKSYDFEAVSVKLIFPKTHQMRQWPFYLAFKLPGRDPHGAYLSDVSLTILGNGTFDQWKDKKCTIDLRGDRMNPDDWRPFISIPPGVNGLFHFRYHGEGVLSQILNGELECGAQALVLQNNGNTLLTAPEADCLGKVSVTDKRFIWSDTTLHVGGLKIRSTGELDNWKEPDTEYNVKLSTNLNDPSDLNNTSLWRFFPGVNKDLKKPPDLKGSAIIELNLVGNNVDHKIFTVLKTHDMPLSQLLTPDRNDPGLPLLSLLEIDPNSPIKGQIEISANKQVLLQDVELQSKGGPIKITGYIDIVNHEHEVKVTADDLVLNQFNTSQLETQKSSSQKPLQSAANPGILLSGKVKFNAHFKQTGNEPQEINVSTTLQNANLGTPKKGIIARSLNGNLDFDGKVLKLVDVRGTLANASRGTNTSGGSFVLDGSLGLEKNGTCALTFAGNHVDVASLVSFTRAANIPVSDDMVGPMHGLAKQMNIAISGKSEQPVIALSLVPEDMYYQMAATTGNVQLRQLKINGGNISYANNNLELKDLGVTSSNGKLLLSANFSGELNKLSPRTIHIKSTSMDISELSQYMASQTMPADTRANYVKFTTPIGVSGLQGKIYGDLVIDFTRGKGQTDRPSMSGLIGLNNASGRIGANNLLFEHLSGVINLSDDELNLQDMNTTFVASHVNFQGSIKKYQTDPQWNIQLAGQVRPQDLLKLTSADKGGLQDKLDVTANGPIAVRTVITGQQDTNKITFAALADPLTSLRIKANCGNYAQPGGMPLTVDGAFTINSQPDGTGFEWHHCHVLVGDNAFHGHGKFKWFNDKTKSPEVEFSLRTPSAVPLPVVFRIMNPDADVDGVAGTIKANFGVSGTVDAMVSHGDAHLSNIALPGLQLKNINGDIHTPRWSVVHDPQNDSKADSLRSEAKIDLSTITMGNFPLHDLSANVVLENAGSESTMTLSNGIASLAGGKVQLNGNYGTASNKWALDLAFKQLQVDEFVTDVFEHSGQITGLADGKISLQSAGSSYNDGLSKLQGQGDISIYKGAVPKVGELQEKLTQANLLQQGLFGFNFNNVLSSVLPVKTGRFTEASISFQIANGTMNIDRMLFDGSDLRLRAAGTWSIPTNVVSMDVAGNIPRVASSILPGAVGEVSRNFTIQKAVRVVTFNKLESLPSFPILGDIGTDEPRAFTFKVSASLNTPDNVSKSIQKSFKWLPNKPNASAHPIPGINIDINLKPSAFLRFAPMARIGHIT